MRAASRRTRLMKRFAPGKTGHAEIVQVVFDPKKISYRDLLAKFWEEHNPTEGMRQGNDVARKYRSNYPDHQR